MANLEESQSRYVLVNTTLETHIGVLLHKDDTSSDFKEKLCEEHKQCYPGIGEIEISALKVKRRNQFFHCSDSMILSKAFQGISTDWNIYVDAVRVLVKNNELLEIEKEKETEIAIDDTIEDGLETKVVADEKTTKKRKMESLDGKRSRKKYSDVDESQELCGKAEAEVTTAKEDTLIASGAHIVEEDHNNQPISIKVAGDCDGEIVRNDLASKVGDSEQRTHEKGEADHDVITKKMSKIKRKIKQNKNQKTDDVLVPRNDDDVPVPRNEEKPEFVSLSSSILVHNNVVQGVGSIVTRDSPRCTCQGLITRKLIVLDLNGILADVVQDYKGQVIPDGKISGRSVFKRPFVASFLEFCFERFEVGIWSSRLVGLDYMNYIVMANHAKNLMFCFDQHMCTTTRFNTPEKSTKPLFLKDLRKVWERLGTCVSCGKVRYDESNTLLIDDSPHKALCNPPYTGIFPFPYQYTDSKDSALSGELMTYMERLAEVDHVQKFVAENPIGQAAINERHESWQIYSQVIEEYKYIDPGH